VETWHCPHLLLGAVLRTRAAAAAAVQQSFYISYQRAHSSKPAARCGSGRTGQTDRRADRTESLDANFIFHKVVCQHVQGVVGYYDLMALYKSVYYYYYYLNASLLQIYY